MLIVFYEWLCFDARKGWEIIYRFLNKRMHAKLFEASSRPSSSSELSEEDLKHKRQLDLWQRELTKSQIDSAMKIMGLFALDKIYSYDALPVCSNLEVIGYGS